MRAETISPIKTPLDALYLSNSGASLYEVLTLFAKVPYTLKNNDIYNEIISSIDQTKEINHNLAKGYADNLNNAVSSVFSNNNELASRLKASVTRFAYFKAHKVTNALKEIKKNNKDADYPKIARACLNTFNRYQASEYNTAIGRSRTAEQFYRFTSDETNNMLFPNIIWLPSLSANPRELHMPFYNRVWAKNDPFWSENQPGALWNCKCDWEQTAQEVTKENPTISVSAPGLKGNPAITGEVFSSDASYFKVGGNAKQKQVEKICQSTARSLLQKNYKQYEKQTATAQINNQKQTIHLSQWAIRETAQSMFGSKLFWLKNEILKNFDFFLSKAKYTGSKDVNLTHNTGKTLRKKRQFAKFHYFTIKLGGDKFCLQVVERKKGDYFLYTITKNKPI